ncbi:PTS system ascorbate-specific IIC component (L-Asc family) [Mycoplasma testudineum]|uniref:Ascorbate-specific PTS system EIIC component n=1 Tax=Mycoplasma testudineum TaxID=244584 RepID=A0A4R6IJM8_9MOLU|nr:PTS ascorbate transporter subunit IIC [Mycoplasma testudineum]OYD26444.1 PTS ascorbate transporter subunit IIC [Mycoplasma testudineum]TDO22146.1 PTS system ascorbate-specific IIC component (L-Asc family) [Mycoplasma testudineum]
MPKKSFKSKSKIYIGWGIFLLINLIIIALVFGLRMGLYNDSASVAAVFLIEQIYLNQFLKQPQLLLGAIVFLGYMILGRGFVTSVLGAIKTIIGFLLLNIGAGALVGLASPVFNGIQSAIGLKIVPLDPYLGWTSANAFLGSLGSSSFVSLAAYVFVIGFAVNILLVVFKKWTNVHSLMLTGHVMFQQAAIATVAIYIMIFRSVALSNGSISAGVQFGTIAITGIFLGMYWGVGSTSTLKATNAVTENAGFAIGHQQMFAASISYKLGKYFGKKEDNAENRILPKYLKIFEDNIFTQVVILFILFAALILIIYVTTPDSIIAKNGYVYSFTPGYGQWNVFGGAHPVINIMGGALKLVASIIAIITGVRMFVTELQQAFQGISEKIIPGAVIGVDIAAVYGFSPNALTYGFVSGTIGKFLGVGIIIGLTKISGVNNYLAVPIPLFIALFFSSGALGIYANASGGWKASIIVPLIWGILSMFAAGLGIAALSQGFNNGLGQGILATASSPWATGYLGMEDWSFFFGIVMLIGGYAVPAGYIAVFGSILIMIFIGQLIDSGLQEKPTFLQKILKLKPELKTVVQE